MRVKGFGFTSSSSVNGESTGRFYLNGRMKKHNKTGFVGCTAAGYSKKYIAAVCEVKNENYADAGSFYALRAIKKSKDKLAKGLVRKYVREACRDICDNVSGSSDVEREFTFGVLNMHDNRASVYCEGGCKTYLLRNGILVQASRENEMSKIMNEHPELFKDSGNAGPSVEEFGEVQPGDVFLICGYELSAELTDFEVGRIWEAFPEQKKFTIELSRRLIDDRANKDFTLVTVGVY